MPADSITINQTIFGFVVGIASSAFTAGATYTALVGRIKRLEECHEEANERADKADARFETFKAQREMLTDQWREDTRKRDVRDAEMAMTLKHLTDMVVALCDKARVPL